MLFDAMTSLPHGFSAKMAEQREKEILRIGKTLNEIAASDTPVGSNMHIYIFCRLDRRFYPTILIRTNK